MVLNERLKELRMERNETQTQVAGAVGMTIRQYQRYEAGEQKPGYYFFCALADHFSVSLDYLAGRTDQR